MLFYCVFLIVTKFELLWCIFSTNIEHVITNCSIIKLWQLVTLKCIVDWTIKWISGSPHTLLIIFISSGNINIIKHQLSLYLSKDIYQATIKTKQLKWLAMHNNNALINLKNNIAIDNPIKYLFHIMVNMMMSQASE